MSLAQLAQRALLGLRNAPTVPADASPLGAWLEQATHGSEPATQFLRAAATWQLAERAGQIAAYPDCQPLPECPSDARRVLPSAAGHALRRVLDGFQPGLFEILLREIAQRGMRLPETLLPRVLEHGRHHSHRAAVMAVACAVARWLGERNPEWAYVTGVDDSARVFAEGAPAARREAFRRLRAGDAAAARDALIAGWDKETPDDRAALIKSFEVGLSDGDEEFLERGLDDRRKEVRTAAAALLAQLPGSRLVQRMIARADPLLKLGRGLLGRSLDITLPGEADKAAQRDGIDAKAVEAGQGERASVLIQLLAAVPPSHWCARFDIDAEKLLSFTRKHEFGSALRAGLARAAVNFSDFALARAWFAFDTQNEFRIELDRTLPPLLARLPDSETFLLREIEQHGRLPLDWLRAQPSPCSARLSRACVALLQRRVTALNSDSSLRYSLPLELGIVAHVVTPERAMLDGWDPNQPLGAIEEFFAVIEFRLDFHRFLEQA